MDQFVCVKDFADAAQQTWESNILSYFNGAADDEITVQENRDSYNRIQLRPRFLRDVSKIDTSVSILGRTVQTPIGISPTAMQCLLHPDGELATVSAAENTGTIFILSFHSTKSIEEVAAKAPGCRKWLQLSLYKGRSYLASLVQRAERAGFEAIVLSIDTPVLGKRRQVTRVPLELPPHLTMANLTLTADSAAQNGEESGSFDHKKHDFQSHTIGILEASYTWEIIQFLKSHTKLPIVLKGVQTGEDAELAVNNGASGILISNHGGRQLDCVAPTIEILPEIVSAVQGRIDVYVDGGVMRGSDIFKALALGAKMVFVGRGILWGLGIGGKDGVEKVLNILREELHSTMALTGTKNISEINSTYLRPRCQK